MLLQYQRGAAYYDCLCYHITEFIIIPGIIFITGDSRYRFFYNIISDVIMFKFGIAHIGYPANIKFSASMSNGHSLYKIVLGGIGIIIIINTAGRS